MATRRKNYTGLHLALDLVLTLITGGLWLLWIAIRFLRANS